MSYSRKYDFKDGTKISSSQVDEEFDQLIAAVNLIQANDIEKDLDVRSKAQMSKITADSGGTKLTLTDNTKDILVELLNLGIGLHSFYCVAGATNNPANNRPIRGLFHQNATGFGWIICLDSVGNLFRHYINNGTWQGWRGGQTVLWSGQYYPNASATITPSKKLSQCENGWILIWSDFDPPSTANDFDWSCTYVPKYLASISNGSNHLWAVPKTPSTVIVKRGNVYDDKIIGHDDNALNGGDDVVLRYILEW